MIDRNRKPSQKELRWFGAMLLLLFAAVGLVAYWKAGAKTTASLLWSLGGLVALAYYSVRPLRRPIYAAWMKLVYPLGWILSHLLLGTIFFLVITPIGFLMRLFGRDPMRRQLEVSTPSYWLPHRPTSQAARYFQQF